MRALRRSSRHGALSALLFAVFAGCTGDAAERTTDAASASASSSDPDGDTVSLTYDWTVNGIPVGASGASLDGGVYFDKGDVVAVTHYPHTATVIEVKRIRRILDACRAAAASPALPLRLFLVGFGHGLRRGRVRPSPNRSPWPRARGRVPWGRCGRCGRPT